MRRPGLLLLATLLAPCAARAQALRGRVVGADSVVVSGAIVTLLDSGGVPLARALADDQGRFAMRLPAPGAYRVQVMRLGFRPSLDSLVRVAGTGVVDRRVVLTGAPVSLRTIHVTGEQQCLGGDSTAAAFAVWEEARKALLASQLTRAMRAYTMDVELFSNRQSSDPREPPTVARSLRQLSFLRPFTTLPADRLAREGYLTRSNSGDIYHAPDEDVLLSPSFAETHCMKLLPDSGSGELVRLGFAPLPDRRLPDIRGVLALDRASAELRTMSFVYVNLRPEEMIGSPGGDLAWRRLPEGSWIIDYWAIGLPVMETRTNRDQIRPIVGRGVLQPPTRAAQQLVGRGRVTTGGGVARIAFGDTIVWVADEPLQPRIRVPLPP